MKVLTALLGMMVFCSLAHSQPQPQPPTPEEKQKAQE